MKAVPPMLLAPPGARPAPAAAAKGPHATVATGPTGIEPGRPWITTVTLFEYPRARARGDARRVVLRSGDRRITATPKRLGREPESGDQPAEARYRLRVAFPAAGLWSYTVFDGTPADRRFRFPTATVGGGSERVTTGFVAFPQGSEAAAQGAGGEIVNETSRPVEEGADGVRPPRVYRPAADDSGERGAGLAIAAGGLAFAGVGAFGGRAATQARGLSWGRSAYLRGELRQVVAR